MESSKPTLPKKLPLEARKKLSVTNLIDSTARESLLQENDNDDYIYSSYLSPFEPQIDRNPVKSDEKLEFFNDSIYFTDDDAYSSLALYSSSEPVQKRRPKPQQQDTTNEHNIGRYLIDINDKDMPKPQIPPKRRHQIDISKLSLSNDFFANRDKVNKTEIIDYDDELVTYIQPTDTDKKAFTFDDFKSGIFTSRENRMCADCKCSEELPTWVSCVYFMLYCDYCAETHLKLSHTIRPFYMIELDQIYQTLMDSEFFCDVHSFVYMIREQAGNEKINSLLEFQMNDVVPSFDLDESAGREKFIKEKYLSKKYANQSELMGNVDELNRSLMNYCVVGPCLPITIFNIFMGANINSIARNRRSALDNATDFNQKYQILYLKFQNALTYHQIISKTLKPEEFVGELNQIIDLNNRDLSRSKIMLKLCNDNKMLIVYLNRQTQLIYLNTIVRISNIGGDRLIEIKWLNLDTSSILSTYIEFYNSCEKHLWMKELCGKMSGRMLCADDESLRIDSMAYFEEIKFDSSTERCLVVLLFEARSNRPYKKKIVVFYRDSKIEIDVRKVVRIRLDDELLVIDVLPTRSFKFRSSSSNEIAHYHQCLKSFAQLHFASIDEQFLNKDNCPLVIDKLCSFVEIFFLTEKSFYGDLTTFENKSRLKSLFARLESERDFSLNKKLLNSNSVLTLFRIYFGKYFRHKEIELIKAAAAGNLLKSSPILFTTLKRLTSHLVLISRYQQLNHHSIDYLSHLFSHLISPETALNLSYYLINYEEVFGLSEEYFKLQTNIVDKLAAMKLANNKSTSKQPIEINNRLNNYLTNIYLTSKSSGRFFQISISQTTRPRDILKQAIAEFNLTDKTNLSLFEVIDAQFCYLTTQGSEQSECCLLERVLPVNAAIVNDCHDWCKFNFVVKANYFNTENSSCSASFHDSCLSSNLILMKNSGKSSQDASKKWRNSYLSVQNACIRVTERKYNATKESTTTCEEDDDYISSSNTEMKKLFEAKVEECLVYYGLYEDGDYSSSSSSSLSSTALDSTSTQSTTSLETPVRSASFIRRLLSPHTSQQHVGSSVFKENCLTFYHLAENTAHSVCLDSRSNALKRYACLFKLAHYPDTWSI